MYVKFVRLNTITIFDQMFQFILSAQTPKLVCHRHLLKSNLQYYN